MPKRIAVEVWQCPVCGATEGVSSGKPKPFVSARFFAYHMTGKARNSDLAHQERFRAWIPFMDSTSWKQDELAAQLVKRILEFTEDDEGEEEPQATRDSATGAVAIDSYRLLREIEIGLHSFVRRCLQKEFADDRWFHGIPENIRLNCVADREKEQRQKDPFSYTTFIHLKGILDKRWALFEGNLKGAKGFFEAQKRPSGSTTATERVAECRYTPSKESWSVER